MAWVRALFVLAAALACVPAAGGADDAPLDLVATIPLPGVKGRVDHLSVDVKGHRLFVAALASDTVEVLDTQANRPLASLRGFGEPQGLLYLPAQDRLFVANGSANRLDILDGTSLEVVRRVEGLPDADNLRFDAASGKVVVGYGAGALRFLDPSGSSAGELRLPAHPEGFQLEQAGRRIFVNVPGARQVAVLDRDSRDAPAAWGLPGARANFPMALDEAGRRLFVGARNPAVLLVYDIDRGVVVARRMIGEDPDDVFFDAKRGRVLVVCGTGHVEVFRREAGDRYAPVGQVLTSPWARTGLWVPEEDRLYVAGAGVGRWPAQVFVFTSR